MLKNKKQATAFRHYKLATERILLQTLNIFSTKLYNIQLTLHTHTQILRGNRISVT